MICGVLEIKGVVSLTVLIADGELLACALCGVKHLLCFLGVDSHGLFTHNVLACLEGVNGYKAVRTVGSADVHNVDRLVAKQLFVIGVNLCVGCAVLLAGSLRALFDDVAERDHVDLGNGLQTDEVLAVGDTAAADYTDSYFVICSDRHIISSGI